MAEFLEFMTSALLTGLLGLLAIYFTQRAARGGMDTPAVWGATGATVAITGLHALVTANLLTGEPVMPWIRTALSTIAIAGIVQFWLFYRRVIVIDPKQGKTMRT